MKALLIGAGAALVTWFFIRRKKPLVIYQTRAPEANYFRSLGQRIGQHLEVTPIGVGSLRELWEAIDSAPGGRNIVVLVGHGTPRTFFPGYGVTVQNLAQHLRPKLGMGAVIGLAGCRSGADPGSENWAPESFGPGGAESFAGLRDLLRVEVRAHTTTGDATANPAARVFLPSGGPGLSALDMVLGEGAWRDPEKRSWWTSQFRGKLSEFWITGGSLPWHLRIF